ncbi:MAG: chaperone NapD [Ignavibacteriae bacterium]|nr:chaperone NapD [Ignavibacteriota bacterium]
MYISGVVVQTDPHHVVEVTRRLSAIENVSVFGQKDDAQIVAVLEADSPEALQEVTEQIEQTVDGVYGVFPVYVSNESLALAEEEA